MDNSILLQPGRVGDIDTGKLVLRSVNEKPVLAITAKWAGIGDDDVQMYVYVEGDEHTRAPILGKILDSNEIVAVLSDCEIFAGDDHSAVCSGDFDVAHPGTMCVLDEETFLCVQAGNMSHQRAYLNLVTGDLRQGLDSQRMVQCKEWSLRQKRGNEWHKLMSFSAADE